MLRARRSIGPVTAALIALLMLGYASVRATVMQVAGMPSASQASMCGDPAMSGMAMSGMGAVAAGARHGGPAPADHAKHPAACPYCSAGANPPVIADIAPPRLPTRLVFIVFHIVESHGPRGPPAFEPRARGPPASLTTA